MRKSFVDSVAQGTSSLNKEAVGAAPPNSNIVGVGTDRLAAQAALGAPYNPFARTLASIEQGYSAPTAASGNVVKLGREQPEQGGGGLGRGTMDVDAFTKMLLTGNSGTASPVGLSRQLEPLEVYRPEGSSLTPEYRRPSMFESVSQIHPESPQLSYDERSSDEEKTDDLSGLMNEDQAEKAKPPPPQHHHGKLFSRKGPQTVSFAEFDTSVTSSPGLSPATTKSPFGLGLSRPALISSISDVNKPLPAPPAGSSSLESGPDVPIKDEEIMSIHEPEEQIDEDILSKRARPAPPIARRSSQTYAKSGRTRSSSNLSKSSMPDDFGEDPDTAPRRLLAPSQKPPPPPPTRRTANPLSGSERDSSVPPAASVTSTQSSAGRPPPPPPSRGMRVNPGLTRTPSSQSNSSLGTRRPSPSLGQVLPPPPPPPRRTDPKRTSIDGSRYGTTTSDARRLSDTSHRGSTEIRRLSGASWNSGRTPSISSLQNVPEDNLDTPIAKRHEAADQTNEHDILGDMAAFQREVDELRARVGK